jgi:hypothetical protein
MRGMLSARLRKPRRRLAAAIDLTLLYLLTAAFGIHSPFAAPRRFRQVLEGLLLFWPARRQAEVGGAYIHHMRSEWVQQIRSVLPLSEPSLINQGFTRCPSCQCLSVYQAITGFGERIGGM